MSLFNRKKSDTTVLPEIERYYDAEKRERAGLAWLLAVVSIACAALILIGVFFGGRWIYRKVTDTNKTPGISITDKSNKSNGGIAKAPDTVVGNSSASTPSTTPAPATTPTTPAAPTPIPAATTPTTRGPGTPGGLANTGPADTMAIFITASVGFAVLHNLLTRSRRSVR